MGNVLGTKETLITTNEGLKLIRRVRTGKRSIFRVWE